MDWLNFGNFQDNGGQQSNEDELFKQLNSPEVHQNLADYMNANYGDKGNGPMPTTAPTMMKPDEAKAMGFTQSGLMSSPAPPKDDSLKYLSLFTNNGSYNPDSSAWYNQGLYAHKAGMSLGSILSMI